MPRIEHRRREPAPGVFRLVLPLPFPGLDRVNCYLLADGDAATLIDCGIYMPAQGDDDHGWRHLEEALAACGFGVGDVERLVLTHTHIDHYGMAGTFKARSGCEVVMHPAAETELDGYRDPQARIASLRALYADHGVEVEELDELTRYEDWRGFVSELIGADREVVDGDTISVGGRDWTVVHTPGHAVSHICLWSEGERLLISGDHLLPSVTPHIDFRRDVDEDPLGDFLASLSKVERLGPDLVLPGHGHPFEDGAERARVVARHHDRRLGAILQVIRREPATAEEITDAIFGEDLLNFEHRLALGEALAHLAYLRRRDEVERVESEGRFAYRKVSRRPGPT